VAAADATTQHCPVCWAQVRPGAQRCPACGSDLTGAQATADAARARVAPVAAAAEAAEGTANRRWGPLIVGLVGLAAALTVVTLLIVPKLLPPPAEYGAGTGNVGPRVHVTAANAVAALLAFVPAGDHESVGVALDYATLDRVTNRTGRTYTVRPGPSGSQIVTVRAPVDVAFLRKVNAIQLRLSPNLSNLKTGRLAITAADDNTYGLVIDPKTQIGTFVFRVAADDGTIWPDNLNALQVVSQSQAVG